MSLRILFSGLSASAMLIVIIPLWWPVNTGSLLPPGSSDMKLKNKPEAFILPLVGKIQRACATTGRPSRCFASSIFATFQNVQPAKVRNNPWFGLRALQNSALLSGRQQPVADCILPVAAKFIKSFFAVFKGCTVRYFPL